MSAQNICHIYQIFESKHHLSLIYIIELKQSQNSDSFFTYVSNWYCHLKFVPSEVVKKKCCKSIFPNIDKSFSELKYTRCRETPQIQLSRHNHFPQNDREKRKINGVRELWGRGRILHHIASLTHFLSAPVLFAQLKSPRYIIGANQSRMRKALR